LEIIQKLQDPGGMMKVDQAVVENIAQLAQLEVNSSNLQSNIDSISRILDLVDEMQSVNTDGIEPLAHPLDATQRLRKDQVSETDQRALFQSIAPKTEDGLYLVPKVIE
jgi:aspartyl-tRNA(Asn)/glutamyl-tRNA(Gln) amidotransferase subunit C